MSSAIKYQRTKDLTVESFIGKSAWIVVKLSGTLDRLSVKNKLTYSAQELVTYANKHCTTVTIVGSNPSGKSPDNSAFHPETKSRQFVDEWFEEGGYDIEYINLIDHKTENNKQLKKSDIEVELTNIRRKLTNKRNFIACGKIAAMGLNMAGANYFEMPHPSGLCRFWNDKEAGEAKVTEMKEWLNK